MVEIGFSRIVFLGIDLLDEQFMKSRLEGYEEIVKEHHFGTGKLFYCE